jgi:CheY-like chemotaxis protein
MKSARILIVDDEPVIRRVLENQLQLGGYEVLQASDGAEALAIISEMELPDLIILDIMMPRMSGYEVCEKIREKLWTIHATNPDAYGKKQGFRSGSWTGNRGK